MVRAEGLILSQVLTKPGKIMKFLLFLHLLFFSFCVIDSPVKEKEKTLQNKPVITNSGMIRTVFWEQVCATNEFSDFFYCNTHDAYHVELLSAFKDYIVITADISDSIYNYYHCARFSPRVNKPDEKPVGHSQKRQFVTVINPLVPDTLYFEYGQPKIIKAHKNPKLDDFFINQIWQTRLMKDTFSFLDPETWRISSRKMGKEIQLMRTDFKDSVYYSNIQMLLDICKIKDYQFNQQPAD